MITDRWTPLKRRIVQAPRTIVVSAWRFVQAMR
jgi:hypothetical protein